MPCGYKDASGKVCGGKTSVNPKTNQPYEYCLQCVTLIRKNRSERFNNAVKQTVGKHECQWIGNYKGAQTFRVKCIEAPVNNGFCTIHKEIVEPVNVDVELSQLMGTSTKKSKDAKLKVLAENPELSEDDNITIVSLGKSVEKTKKAKESRKSKSEPEVVTQESPESQESQEEPPKVSKKHHSSETVTKGIKSKKTLEQNKAIEHKKTKKT